MKVKDIMTANPACCTPDMSLKEVAQMMRDCDCGAIPVVDSLEGGHPIGIVTDRDIVVRAMADGQNPLDARVRTVMSQGAITIDMDRSIEQAARMMKDNQVRRLVVTDGNSHIIGMLAQADIAREGRDRLTGDVVEEISEPVGKARSSAM